MDPANAPIAVFNFKYRSRKALREEMVIPSSAGGQTEADGRINVNSLSIEELRRLARERVEDMDERKVKQEPVESCSFRALKVLKMDDGREMIDLTQDDD